MTDEDRNWIAAVDEAYRPPEMTAAQRVDFRERLEARLWRRRALRAAWLVPALTGATALGVWLALPEAPQPTDVSEAPLYAYIDPSAATEEQGEYLPEDYVALAALLEIDAAEL
jgi:hypothetical protein